MTTLDPSNYNDFCILTKIQKISQKYQLPHEDLLNLWDNHQDNPEETPDTKQNKSLPAKIKCFSPYNDGCTANLSKCKRCGLLVCNECRDDYSYGPDCNKCMTEEFIKIELRRRNTREKLKEYRKQELLKAIKAAGLEFRDDSKLYKGYINGDLNTGHTRDKTMWTLDTVIHRMSQVKYLFDHCNMAHELNNYWNSLSDEYEHLKHQARRHNYSFTYTKPFDMAEKHCLKRYGQYPTEWPWLVKQHVDDKQDHKHKFAQTLAVIRSLPGGTDYEHAMTRFYTN